MDKGAHPISGHLAWRAVSKVTDDVDAVTAGATALADLVPSLLASIDTPEAAATPHAARASSAAEFAAAAARLRHVAMRLQVASVHLVDHEAVHLSDSERTTRTWVANHAGLSHNAASELCRVAETCERYPKVAAAFHTGDITVGHVDAISRIIPSRFRGETLADAVEKLRDVQDVLLGAAREASVGDFGDLCGRARDRLDTDGPTDPAAEPSRIWLKKLFNGRYSLTGDLTADDGALVETFLQRLRAKRARAKQARAERAASATAEPEPHGGPAPDIGPAAESEVESDTSDPTTYAEHRASDLIHLMRAGAGAEQPGRIALFLHINLSDLNASAHGKPDGLPEMLSGRRPAHTEAGLDISDETLWALMADADVTPFFNLDGRSLSFGRTRRLAPPMLQRLLAHRDQQCRFPGCGRPPIWHEAHHIEFWDEHDGQTDPTNCCGFCGFHHHGVHDRGFGVTGDAEGDLTVTDPDGTPFDPTPRYLRGRPPRGAPSRDDPGEGDQIAS